MNPKIAKSYEGGQNRIEYLPTVHENPWTYNYMYIIIVKPDEGGQVQILYFPTQFPPDV